MAHLRRLPRRPLFPVLAALSALTLPNLAEAQVGPGIGNIDCGDAEYFKPFAFVDHGYPNDPHGQNVTVMIRGYFMTVYAPDSGRPPGRIGLYDVSNPRNPVEVDYYSGADPDRFREQHSLPIALIDGKQYIAIQTLDGIQFWDFTDPLSAFVAGRIDLPGVDGGDYENVAWQASWQGRYLYVSGGNQGIYVIDAADPANPELLEQTPTSSTGGFRVGPLFALGDLLVISNMDQGGAYAVLDISRPDEPALLDSLGNAPRMYAISVGKNDRFYTAGRDGNFLIHSFSDPTNITEIKNALIGQDQLYTAVQDDFVYLGRQNNVVKVDVTDENNPEVIGEGNLGRANPDHGQVTPIGNLVYIGNDHGTGSAFFCHQMGQDTIPLSADTFYPADGSTGVSTETRVTIVFSDFVDLETVSPENIAIRPAGGEPLSGIFTYQFNQLSFSPDEPFSEDTTYEIYMPAGGVTDAMGNGIAEEVSVLFSTGTMVTVPEPEPPMGTGGAGLPTGGTGGAPLGTGGAGTGGGFVAPTGGAPSSGGTGGAPPVAGTGGTGTDVPPPAGQQPSSSSSSSDSGGCAISHDSKSKSPLLALGLLSAFLAFARRRRAHR